MGDTDRLKRARVKFSRADASLLRAMVHGWLAVDELTILNPASVARQVLAALDALAIVEGTEHEAAEYDEVLRKVNALERDGG